MEDLLRQLSQRAGATAKTPFPSAEIRSLRQVLADEFAKADPDRLFNADLSHFCATVWGWATGGIRKVLPDAAERYRVAAWLENSFFDRFPQYRFLEWYDLSEYPLLHNELETSEALRRLLLEAIRLAGISPEGPS